MDQGTEFFQGIDTARGKLAFMTKLKCVRISAWLLSSLELEVAATHTSDSAQEGKNTTTKTSNHNIIYTSIEADALLITDMTQAAQACIDNYNARKTHRTRITLRNSLGGVDQGGEGRRRHCLRLQRHKLMKVGLGRGEKRGCPHMQYHKSQSLGIVLVRGKWGECLHQ